MLTCDESSDGADDSVRRMLVVARYREVDEAARRKGSGGS
jgi:hypothetical protein